MSDSQSRGRLARAVVTTAGIIVILAGLKLAADLIVPFLMAAFIALLCSAPLYWLHRKGVPNGLSVLIIVVGLLAAAAALGITAGSSFKKLTRNLPRYRESLQQQTEGIVPWLEDRGVDVGAYRSSISDAVNPSSAVGLASDMLKKTSGVLGNSFMILLTVVFILLEAVGMPHKLRRVVRDPEKTFSGFREFLESVKQYLVIKSIVSAVTGLLAGVSMVIIGVDFPVLWGVLAFAFNFVPTIGSIIAAAPPIALGVVQFGPGAVLSVGGCYLAINVVMGNVVEPRLTGQGLGLSALVVFISLVFWGWILGPVGMLLSVPLTMIVKIACESNESTRPVGVLLGPSMPKKEA